MGGSVVGLPQMGVQPAEDAICEKVRFIDVFAALRTGQSPHCGDEPVRPQAFPPALFSQLIL